MIRVTVVAKSGWKYLVLRYRDHVTGEERTRSSGTTNRRQAEREAEKWERELRESLESDPAEIGWDEFVRRYDRDHLGSLAIRSAEKSISVLGAFRDILNPNRMSGIRSQHISQFAAVLREKGLAETTISVMLKTLRAALAWGKQNNMLRELPQFPVVRRAKTGQRARVMKGRSLTPDEFEGLLFEASGVVGASRAGEWRLYLTGLWLSGLRLTESLQLWWDRNDRLCVDLSLSRPMLRIPGALEKGNTDRILPMAPDFAEWLLALPCRSGPVFRLTRQKAYGETPSHWWVSRVVSEIGQRAGIVVDARTGKYASAHDLRRSFGERWSRLVMPQVLMELMRHESIDTTLRYYVGRNAESTAEVLWSVHQQGSIQGS